MSGNPHDQPPPWKGPSIRSVMADMASGMSQADAVKKAAKQLADAIDEQAYWEMMAELAAAETKTEDAP